VGGKGVSADIFFPGMLAYLILILMAPAYNSFAYEGPRHSNLFHRRCASAMYCSGKTRCWSPCSRGNRASIAMLACGSACLQRHAGGYLRRHHFHDRWPAHRRQLASLTFPRKMELARMRGQRQSGMAVLVCVCLKF